VAYKLELPVQLADVHDVFHISQLKKGFGPHEKEPLPLDDLNVKEDLTIVEHPIRILETMTRVRNNSHFARADHPALRIIGDLTERTTRSRVRNNSHFARAAFVATFEPKDIGHALSDHNWVNLMHEKLEYFERNQVWELVDPPPRCKSIGTKWVWKNKEGEKGEVVRNKSRLVAQGFTQMEGIDYEETFAPVAHLEAIRILLDFSVAKGFKLHQMDVKSAFLNGVLEEEVYVRQPLGFESEKYPHRVFKLMKVLYGRLRGFLFERGFEMGKVD
jgi:hypothetical protein